MWQIQNVTMYTMFGYGRCVVLECEKAEVWGHNNNATLQHGQPDQLKLQNSKTRCFKRLLSSSCKLHKRLDQRLLGLLSLNLIQNQILHQVLPQPLEHCFWKVCIMQAMLLSMSKKNPETFSFSLGPWGWGLKTLQCGPLFFKYFRQFKGKKWPSPFCHFTAEAIQ